MKNYIDEVTERYGKFIHVVRFSRGFGHRCGYLGIPNTHPLAKLNYMELEHELEGLEIHGGLTYGGEKPEVIKDYKFFGFDCGHAGDKPDEYSHREYFNEPTFMQKGIEGEVRTKTFCKKELKHFQEEIEKWEEENVDKMRD